MEKQINTGKRKVLEIDSPVDDTTLVLRRQQNKPLESFKGRRTLNKTIIVNMIEKHIAEQRSDLFDITSFVNDVFDVSDYITKNKNAPEIVINQLKTLQYGNDEKKHVLLGCTLLLFGGVGSQYTSTKNLRISLKRIEKLFLDYPEDTTEKFFCSECNLNAQINEVNSTTPVHFDNEDSLIDWMVQKERFVTSGIYEKSFDMWIEDMGCYADKSSDEYKKFLTIENYKSYLAKYFRPSSPIPVMTENKRLRGENIGSKNEDGANIEVGCRFIKDIGKKQREILFTLMVDHKLIPLDTNKKNFAYIFGSNSTPNDFQPIEWIGTKQHLYELTTGVVTESGKRIKGISNFSNKSKTKRAIKSFFTKEGIALNMDYYKNKTIYSSISDAIANFLATL